MQFLDIIPFFDKNFKKKNPIRKKCSRMIGVTTLQHVCSESLQHFKFLSSAAHHCHQWARSQLILNHRILSASRISIKKSDQVQRHLFKSNGFSKSGRKSTGTPLIFKILETKCKKMVEKMGYFRKKKLPSLSMLFGNFQIFFEK